MAKFRMALRDLESWISSSKDSVISSTKLPASLKFMILLAYSWIFQAYNYVSRVEFMWKLSCELASAAALTMIFFTADIFRFHSSIFILIILAHTIWWIPNCNIVLIFKSVGRTKMSEDEFDDAKEMLRNEGEKNQAILKILAFGSISRKERSATSDLDIRIIPERGWNNGIRCCAFASRMRLWALSIRFPLDIYVVGNCRDLRKQIRDDEEPVEIYANDGESEILIPR